jgi:hypothetical protein
MGQAKNAQMDEDTKREIAEAIALEVKLLTKCERHGIVYDAETYCYEDAYKLASHLISKNDELVNIFDGNRTALTDLLKDITSDYGICCEVCEKEKRKDHF